MFWRKRQKPPLNQAISMIHDAIEIAYRYKRDMGYQPTESDLAQLDALQSTLWEAHATSEYIARCMRQRMNGEPEGAAKWTNAEVNEYHYPS